MTSLPQPLDDAQQFPSSSAEVLEHSDLTPIEEFCNVQLSTNAIAPTTPVYSEKESSLTIEEPVLRVLHQSVSVQKFLEKRKPLNTRRASTGSLQLFTDFLRSWINDLQMVPCIAI